MSSGVSGCGQAAEGDIAESEAGADAVEGGRDGPAWTDTKIVEAFGGVVQTVENLRQRLVTEGIEAALERKRRATPPTPRKLDGVAEANLIALRWGAPPAGYGRWSLQLLASELVVLEVVESICPETVRKTLIKTA
jgi:hypothetical protein